MRAGAGEILDHDVDTAWFKRDAIVAVFYVRVLNDDVVAIECAV